MKILPLSEAIKVWECSRASLCRHKVHHKTYYELCKKLRNIIRLLLEDGAIERDCWQVFLRRIRRMTYAASSVPLPFGHPGLFPQEAVEDLYEHLSDCDREAPACTEAARLLLSLALVLSKSQESPLRQPIEALCNNEARAGDAILLKDSKLIRAFSEYQIGVPSLRHLRVIGANQLRYGSTYDRLFIFGPTRWYKNHEYIFNAPRCPEIHLIHYAWLKDSLGLAPSFTGVAPSKIGVSLNERAKRYGDGGRVEEISPEDMISVVNWGDITRRGFGAGPGGRRAEEVEAKLFLLEGGEAVCLEATEGAQALIIDLHGEEEEEVRRVSVREIEPGMFILLRTQGGGDYVVSVADAIMGDRAEWAREYQQRWKSKLREIAQAQGMSSTARDLKDQGAVLATAVNIKNWMGERSIRPHNDSDFSAILKLIGLASEQSEQIKAAQLILQAHRKAGFRIRRMLLKEVMSSDLGELDKTGTAEFELPDGVGGSITAFRVIDLAPDRHHVPHHRLGHRFDAGE